MPDKPYCRPVLEREFPGVRYRCENAILINITQTRDEVGDPMHKRKAAELVEVVSDCIPAA